MSCNNNVYVIFSIAPRYLLRPDYFRKIYKFKFDKTGLKHHLSDHGITIVIPENACAIDTEGQVSIGVYYNNSFKFPEGYRLVSDVFWIEISIPLQKHVKICATHFVQVRDEIDSKKLSFFMASDETFHSSGVLKFIEAPRCTFSFKPGRSYGKLEMNHFCSGCILEKLDHDTLPLRYLVTCVLPTDLQQSVWTADFVVSYALPTCLKVCIFSHVSETVLNFNLDFLQSIYFVMPVCSCMQ